MKKNKFLESEQLADRKNCHYEVTVYMQVYGDSARTYNQSTTFKGSDLLDCRQRALDHYKTIYKHLLPASFCGLPFASLNDSIHLSTAIHSIDFLFIDGRCNEEAQISLSGEGEKEIDLSGN